MCSDRIRTSINVLGDSYGAAVVAHLSTKELIDDVHAPIEMPDDQGDGLEGEDGLELRENGKMDGKAIEAGEPMA